MVFGPTQQICISGLFQTRSGNVRNARTRLWEERAIRLFTLHMLNAKMHIREEQLEVLALHFALDAMMWECKNLATWKRETRLSTFCT
jgi:hypothetical protein